MGYADLANMQTVWFIKFRAAQDKVAKNWGKQNDAANMAVNLYQVSMNLEPGSADAQRVQDQLQVIFSQQAQADIDTKAALRDVFVSQNMLDVCKKRIEEGAKSFSLSGVA